MHAGVVPIENCMSAGCSLPRKVVHTHCLRFSWSLSRECYDEIPEAMAMHFGVIPMKSRLLVVGFVPFDLFSTQHIHCASNALPCTVL
jgi:hypothetical protein